MFRVKVCGITRLEDALLAQDLGAWALGFIFYKNSPRCVDDATVASIVSKLGKDILKVGVFVNEEMSGVEHTVRALGLTHAQLHGSESAEECCSLNVPFIKAFRPKGGDDLKTIEIFSHAFGWLIDAATDEKTTWGGTGKLSAWGVATQLKDRAPHLILSGGLKPENIEKAIEEVAPYALDLSSGVESAPGIKDEVKLRKIFKIAARY